MDLIVSVPEFAYLLFIYVMFSIVLCFSTVFVPSNLSSP